MPTLSFGSAFGQTETQAQDVNNNNANTLSNNTVTYSYNIYNNSNNQKSLMRLHNSSVTYYDNNAKGYLVYPELANNTQQQLPAVIMVHEWWGLNEYIKNRADILAKEGYVVLAVDLYRGEVATTSNRAMELSSSVRNNPASAIDNLRSAVDYVKSLKMVDGSRIASLGWCFGGDWALQLALNTSDNPLAATVIYYGRPVTDAASLSNIHWPILGIFGDQDQAIRVEAVKQFTSALNASGITNEIYLYKGVGHAFANPSGDSYAPKETVDAWQKTLTFLKRYL
ncbi:MAG: dienelactone hydrolase family protein [Thermoproteota archaeon]|nr:dienelactone hydrolase family protein [Thermoproteota archaeon]